MLTEQDYRKALVARHPFWQRLSPTAVKQHVDQLLSAANAADLVQALSPVELTLMLKEVPDARPLMLQLAQPEQIRLVLDLDCWHKDELQSPRILEWLEELQRSGIDTFTQALTELDAELLVAFLRQYLRVQATLPPEEEDEPRTYEEALVNELYRAEFIDPEGPRNDRVQNLLNFMRAADLDQYNRLMQAAMWEQDSELLEWAYRWKSGRLQDEGFPEYYEALEYHHLVDLQQLAPESSTVLDSPAPPESAEEMGMVPTYAWSFTPPGSYLERAMTGAFSAEVIERLCWEMVALCNRALIYDQVDFADTAAVRASFERVHARLNIGLDYLGSRDKQPLPYLLNHYALSLIYQVGFTLVMHLYGQATRIQHHLTQHTGVRRTYPQLITCVLQGLLLPQPKMFRGLHQPGAVGYSDFRTLHDITLVIGVLKQIEAYPAYHVASAS
ncbi:MAG: hypothetical protein ETSY2_24870 [Candidatus Entotheonella gemina]|uniref:Uncharacterized protein n=1 Tax=Candidatus Entotheonella gemina TaxID=1429439 RepID=W4M4I6_9BACT|nr:MAG: hypothetical protein ETSY2_24870 [Candidatus Entotheonella gemina]